MTHKTLAAALLSALALASLLAPGAAQARTRHHHYHLHSYGLPYDISYLHNYGPGALPGRFAFYDGPANNYCAQGSAVYIGQDHRKYPCF
jgi:hypothetical protein